MQMGIDKKVIVAIIVLAVLVLALVVGAFVLLRTVELPSFDIAGIFASDDEGETAEVETIEPTEVDDFHELVGIWAWDEGIGYEYHFFQDGTGRRGWDEEIQTFTWSIGVHQSGLVITLDEPIPGHMGMEVWNYVIDGDVLTLSNMRFEYSYIRVGAAGEVETIGGSPELVGIWAWDVDDVFEYHFFPDGTGIRGWSDETLQTFIWSTTNAGGLTMTMDDPGEYIAVERWSYVINGDVLTITSRQVPGMEWSYIRVG